MKQDDVDAIITHINVFWPNYKVTKENILNPTHAIVMDIYHMYLLKIDEILASIFISESTEMLGDIMKYCPLDIDEVLFLYLHLNNWFKSININYFTLMDLYLPKKRSKTTIKLALNFLLYFMNNVRKSTEIIMNLNDEKEVQDELNRKIVELKEVIAELSYNVGLEVETQEQHMKKYKKVKGKEVELKDIKVNDDAKLKQLQCEVDSLGEILSQKENLLESSDKEEAFLYEQIVTEEEYESFLKALDNCSEELTDLNRLDEEYIDNLKNKLVDLEHFEKLHTMITTIDCCSLDIVKNIESIKEELVVLDKPKSRKEMENKVCTVAKVRQGIKELEKVHEAQMLKSESALKKIKDESEDLEKQHTNQKSYNAKTIVERETLLLEIEKSAHVCNSFKNDMESVHKLHVDTYKQMLMAESVFSNKLSAHLSKIMNIIE